MAAAPPVFQLPVNSLLPVSGRVALRQAALTVWLPTLLPFCTGQLGGDSQCLTTYLLSLPLVPGMIVPAALHLERTWFCITSGLVVMALFAVVVAGLLRLPRPWSVLLRVFVVLAVAGQAIGYANALRA